MHEVLSSSEAERITLEVPASILPDFERTDLDHYIIRELFEPLEPSAPPRMGERPTSPVGPNLPMLSATSLSRHEMVGLTTNAEVRHTEPEVGVSTLYARVHAVPVSTDVMLGRTGNAIAVDGNLNVTLSATSLSPNVMVESAMSAEGIHVTDQSLEPNLSVLPAAGC